MITVNSHDSSSQSRVTINASKNAEPLSSVPANRNEIDTISSMSSTLNSSTLSTLALQLSEAAARAEHRVGQRNDNPLHSITGDNYLSNKAQHDAELPSIQNPELLDRARQATGFVNGTDSNPFKGLTRDQLGLISQDDGGSFTVNERRAAWKALQSITPSTETNPKPALADGRDIMVSRLYLGYEPPVAKPPATTYNGTQNHADFLNRDDRALIADMYAYATAEGADLSFVDQVAITLGTYRHYSDGRQLGGSNVRYDGEGYQVTFELKPEGAAIASRILEGSAIGSTRIDQGFLRYILSPDQRAFQHVGGIPFLERMVNKFSSEGADQPPLGSEFATFKIAKFEDHVVQTTNKNIRLPPSQSLTVKTDEGWSLTELGKSEGYTLDKATGLLSKLVAPAEDKSVLTPERKTTRRTFLDALRDTREQLATRRIWPGHLFKLMKNYKP